MSRVTSKFFLSESSVQGLVPIKDLLQQFEMWAGSSLDCVTKLLINDEDILGLLLTEEKGSRERKSFFLEERDREIFHKNIELL